MSSEDNHSRPHALAATLFRDELGDIELPENSTMQPRRAPATNQNKYQEELDDDFLDINLGIQSHIAPKLTSSTPTNTTTLSVPSPPPSVAANTAPPSTALTASPAQASRGKPAQSRIQRRGKKGDGQPKQPLKEVDIDG
jgi:hypothetical protein